MKVVSELCVNQNLPFKRSPSDRRTPFDPNSFLKFTYNKDIKVNVILVLKKFLTRSFFASKLIILRMYAFQFEFYTQQTS